MQCHGVTHPTQLRRNSNSLSCATDASSSATTRNGGQKRCLNLRMARKRSVFGFEDDSFFPGQPSFSRTLSTGLRTTSRSCWNRRSGPICTWTSGSSLAGTPASIDAHDACTETSVTSSGSAMGAIPILYTCCSLDWSSDDIMGAIAMRYPAPSKHTCGHHGLISTIYYHWSVVVAAGIPPILDSKCRGKEKIYKNTHL